MNLVEHLKRQIAWSRATFGPAKRTKGVIDHIRKELIEIETAAGPDDEVKEWTDVAILALDGLTRAIVARGYNTDAAAGIAAASILEKQGRNEEREWPDWRKFSEDEAIEHVREDYEQ